MDLNKNSIAAAIAKDPTGDQRAQPHNGEGGFKVTDFRKFVKVRVIQAGLSGQFVSFPTQMMPAHAVRRLIDKAHRNYAIREPLKAQA